MRLLVEDFRYCSCIGVIVYLVFSLNLNCTCVLSMSFTTVLQCSCVPSVLCMLLNRRLIRDSNPIAPTINHSRFCATSKLFETQGRPLRPRARDMAIDSYQELFAVGRARGIVPAGARERPRRAALG